MRHLLFVIWPPRWIYPTDSPSWDCITLAYHLRTPCHCILDGQNLSHPLSRFLKLIIRKGLLIILWNFIPLPTPTWFYLYLMVFFCLGWLNLFSFYHRMSHYRTCFYLFIATFILQKALFLFFSIISKSLCKLFLKSAIWIKVIFFQVICSKNI